jgi:hypothetical protein
MGKRKWKPFMISEKVYVLTGINIDLVLQWGLQVHIKHSCEKPLKQLEEVASNVGLSSNSRKHFYVNLEI